MAQALHILDQASVVAFAALALLAARSDWLRFVIPNRLSLAMAGLWLVHALLLVLQGHPPMALVWAAGVALAVFVISVGLFAANLLGGGDVKLLAAATLWAAPEHVLPFILIVVVSGAVLGLAFLVPGFGNRPQDEALAGERQPAAIIGRLKRPVPYGTAIALGCLALAVTLLTAATPGG